MNDPCEEIEYHNLPSNRLEDLNSLTFEESENLIILRSDYLNITGDFCAAKLMDYLRRRTDWELENNLTPWIDMTLTQIHEVLIGEYSLNVIRRAIALLEEKGILERRKNPDNGQIKTWQYKLNLDVLDVLLQH